MNKLSTRVGGLVLAIGVVAISAGVARSLAGEAVQLVDTTGLPQLGKQWKETNPFRDDPKYKARAIEIGSSAYNQNCARCHGLEVKSGGVAPDLRLLDEDVDGDEWFKMRVRGGAVRDGKVYMPKFAGVLSQEALWAIRTYIDSRPEDD